MKDGITLSPRHGVNPSITKCFWCGEDIGVKLFGKIGKNDDEAPRHIIVNYEPCNKCKEAFKQGILMIGVSEDQVIDNMPPISESCGVKLYPTGAHAVVTEDFAKFIFKDIPKEELDTILKARKVLMPSEHVIQLLKALEVNEEENK